MTSFGLVPDQDFAVPHPLLLCNLNSQNVIVPNHLVLLGPESEESSSGTDGPLALTAALHPMAAGAGTTRRPTAAPPPPPPPPEEVGITIITLVNANFSCNLATLYTVCLVHRFGDCFSASYYQNMAAAVMPTSPNELVRKQSPI